MATRTELHPLRLTGIEFAPGASKHRHTISLGPHESCRIGVTSMALRAYLFDVLRLALSCTALVRDGEYEAWQSTYEEMNLSESQRHVRVLVADAEERVTRTREFTAQGERRSEADEEVLGEIEERNAGVYDMRFVPAIRVPEDLIDDRNDSELAAGGREHASMMLFCPTTEQETGGLLRAAEMRCQLIVVGAPSTDEDDT